MKPETLIRSTAIMAALVGLYGCTDGDDTNITIDAPTEIAEVAQPGDTNGGISQSCPTWSSAREQDPMGKDVCQLPSEILEDRTLTSDITWYMAGRVTVGNGNREMSVTEGTLENGSPVINATLTINPGTQIVARTGTFANLLITRGSKINAVGTASDPIVFSSDDDGFDGTGEWGGLIIHGYGLHNECLTADAGTVACNVDAEGESGFAGGYTADDDSGALSYVVVAEGGYEFAPGNEINGVSLVGVGWLMPIFGFVFGWILTGRGYAPDRPGLAIILHLIGLVGLVFGVIAVAQNVDYPIDLAGIAVVGLVVLLIAWRGWRELIRYTLLYGVAVRLAVIAVTAIAFPAEWGTHFEKVQEEFADAPAQERFLRLVAAQVLFWIPGTVLVGGVFGGVAAMVRGRRLDDAPDA